MIHPGRVEVRCLRVDEDNVPTALYRATERAAPANGVPGGGIFESVEVKTSRDGFLNLFLMEEDYR